MTEEPESTGRRQFLEAAGATAAATSLAGCTVGKDLIDDMFENTRPVETRTRTAGEAGLSRQGILDLAYPDVTATSVDRQVTTHNRNKGWLFDLTDQQYTYGANHGVDFPAFVYATTTALANGGDQNPYTARSREDLVRKGPFGLQFLQSLGLLSGQYDDWQTTPSKTHAGRLNLLGKNRSVSRIRGIAKPGASFSRSDLRTVWVGLALVHDSGDVVYAGVAAVDEGVTTTEPDRFWDLLHTVVPSVTRNPPTQVPTQASPTFANARLVQTISNTRVEDGTHVLSRVDDPDLVAGHRVAPVFDLSVTGAPDMPKWAYFEAHDTFALGRDSLEKVASLGHDSPAVFDRNARGGSKLSLGQTVDDGPSPFRISNNTGSVTFRMEAPCGFEYDSTTLRKGSDYSVANVRPIRVGFIDVRDPDHGSNYGNVAGQANRYGDSVALSVNFLGRTYPGGVYAYRHDDNFLGHRKGLFGRGEFRDFREARKILEKKQSNGNLSPGRFFEAGTGNSRADARRAIRNDGFDVWVLVVPDGYYAHHGQNATGLYPGDHQMAVSTLDRAGRRNDRVVGETTAQEIGHFLVDEPYDHNPRRYPMAQRDDRGSDDSAGGTTIDFDHARHRDSRNFGSSGPLDRPGLVSEGYDFTGGSFRLVEDFTINPGSFTPDSDSPDTDVHPVESFMSYSDDRRWTDAWMHQQLVDTSYGAAKSRDEPIFSGVAHVDEEGGVRFDSTDAFRGEPFTEGTDEGAVLVEMVAPDGETLVSRRVPESFEVETHGGRETVPLVFVQLPFPEAAAEVRTSRGDVVTETNPVVRPLRDAIERVPDRGFVGDADAARSRIDETLDAMVAFMSERAYGAADEQLAQFDEVVSSAVREEYGSLANQPTRGDLLRQSERMHERLAALSEY